MKNILLLVLVFPFLFVSCQQTDDPGVDMEDMGAQVISDPESSYTAKDYIKVSNVRVGVGSQLRVEFVADDYMFTWDIREPLTYFIPPDENGVIILNSKVVYVKFPVEGSYGIAVRDMRGYYRDEVGIFVHSGMFPIWELPPVLP